MNPAEQDKAWAHQVSLGAAPEVSVRRFPGGLRIDAAPGVRRCGFVQPTTRRVRR
jgi:hypothetical protein